MHSVGLDEILEHLASEYLQRINDIYIKSGTTLHLTSRTGHLQLVHPLLKCGVDVDARGVQNQLPLQLASFYGHIGAVQYLLDLGVDSKIRDDNERSLEVCHAVLMRSLPSTPRAREV